MKPIMLQGTGTPTPSGLPRDLEEAAAGRLVFCAVVSLVLMVVALVASFLQQPNIGARAGIERPRWTIVVGIALSVGLWLVARSKRVQVKTKLLVGIGAMVAACALIALFRHSLPYTVYDVLRGFSPVTLVILFFAIVVPMSPRRMAVAATLGAITDPIVLGLTIAAGNPVPKPTLWLWLFLPNAVVIGLAIAAARVVYGLGQIIRKARQMGSSRLVEKLGEGGMGEVWRAEHATLARPAAVKMVQPSVLGARKPEAVSRVLQRFEREAQATAMLSSPHTIELYDYGISEDGTFFYVMELLDGMDLETLLKRCGRLEPERTVHLLLGACHSLRDAHESGVIHRDIKPANIYVCKKGGELDFVKVLDFGLARRVDTDVGEHRVTVAGEMLGTPQYMAPECLGEGDVDARADLYSLGCVAYRMLTGHDVFEEQGLWPLLTAHLQQAPHPLEALAEGVPPQLAGIVMRCLAKAPADRPATSAVLMQELEATRLADRWTPARAQAWWAARDQQEAARTPVGACVAELGSAPTVQA
jgi:eukaryotic-like serine/threonine-protein kinase